MRGKTKQKKIEGVKRKLGNKLKKLFNFHYFFAYNYNIIRLILTKFDSWCVLDDTQQQQIAQICFFDRKNKLIVCVWCVCEVKKKINKLIDRDQLWDECIERAKLFLV